MDDKKLDSSFERWLKRARGRGLFAGLDYDVALTLAFSAFSAGVVTGSRDIAERLPDHIKAIVSPPPRVMVDELRDSPFRIGSEGKMCCLTVDGETDEHLEALHKFAERLGFLRNQGRPKVGVAFYHVFESTRVRALELGAVFVPAQEQAEARAKRRDE